MARQGSSEVTAEPDTYGSLHAGDIVQAADGTAWGVEQISMMADGVRVITLVRYEARWRAGVAAHEPCLVVSRSDVAAEANAYGTLAEAFGDVSLIGEKWTA